MAAQENGRMAEEAAKIWKYLDHLNESNPGEYQKFINKTLKENYDECRPPEPCFCIKTFKEPRMVPKKHVLINVCSWQKVALSKTGSSGIAHLTGKAKDIPWNGNRVMTYDLLMNPSIIQKYKQDINKLAEISISCIEDKFNINLNKEFDICSAKYVGNPDSLLDYIAPPCLKEMASTSQQKEILLTNSVDMTSRTNDCLESFNSENPCKGTKTNLIQEVSSTKNEEILVNNGSKICAPSYELRIEQNNLILEIATPALTSIKDCTLDISEDHVKFSSNGLYALDMELPCVIQDATAKAHFVRNSSILVVSAKLAKK